MFCWYQLILIWKIVAAILTSFHFILYEIWINFNWDRAVGWLIRWAWWIYDERMHCKNATWRKGKQRTRLVMQSRRNLRSEYLRRSQSNREWKRCKWEHKMCGSFRFKRENLCERMSIGKGACNLLKGSEGAISNLRLANEVARGGMKCKNLSLWLRICITMAFLIQSAH